MTKLFSTTVLLFFCTTILLGQNLPFQGKLYEGGSPVNGAKSFAFSIKDGGVDWEETHGNVEVKQGLYVLVLGSITPLPNNLFSDQGKHELFVSVEGTPLDTVTIYAPIENDPTIPDEIKDGISWGEISDKPALDTNLVNELQTLTLKEDTLSLSDGNSVILPKPMDSLAWNNIKYKPTIDTSFTNELQTISLSDDTLFLSQGNYVVIPTPFDTLVSSQRLQIGDQDTTSQIAMSQSQAGSFFNSSEIWQSFQLNSSGTLTCIIVEFGNGSNQSIRLRVYEGDGVGSPAIYDQTYGSSNFNLATTEQTINIQGPSAPQLIEGRTYTFQLSGNNINFTFSSANPYPFGQSSIGADTDLKFQIKMDVVSASSLKVNTDGNVGIGTDYPSSKLEVKGRIKDMTGFVMPVGTILAYGGTAIPEGWLLCDGAEVRRDVYGDLFQAIGTSWGSGDDATTFILPDLRGLFLRGVSGDSAQDPDKDTRTAQKAGGNSGNAVGSIQDDEFESHSHDGDGGSYTSETLTITSGSDGKYYDRAGTDDSAAAGGSETRPKNAYVYYMIKY